jgi:hypothetical protein
VPAELVDLVEALFDLLDLLSHWRFWALALLAVAVAIYVTETVPDPVVRWVIAVPVVTAGVVGGLVWQWRKG